MNGTVQRASTQVLIPLALVVATLYLAREFFIPLALAVLISFLLAPLIRRLERWHLGRVASVLTATVIAFGAIGGLAYVVTGQLLDLANDLPKYRNNLYEKVSAVKSAQNGPLSKATETLRDVTKEVTTSQPVQEGTPPQKLPPGSAPQSPSSVPPVPPVPVAIIDQSGNSFELLESVLTPLIGPLGTAALVIIFVIFILLGLEDLRDRVIHLIGRGHLQVTTRALDEAARRVSRYLLAQLVVNVSYGIPIGVGLYFIGIPNAVLRGLLATLLRFVPYVGPWIAAAFPIVLSLAVKPGWTAPLLTIGLLLVLELVSNNVVEPWLYGSSTGLSAMAVIVAAAFWTWLWGPVGLLLATPLTVCIAVLGKCIPSLSFLDVLLGDRPPIAPEDRFYQRLLAKDQEEICEIAESYTERHSLVETFERVIIPALRLCETDFHNGILSEASRREMHELVRELVLDVGEDHAPELKDKAAESGTHAKSNAPEVPSAVICLPACNVADELVAHMLVRVLGTSGVPAQVCASKMLTSEMVEQVAESSTRLLLISVLPPSSVMPATLICKRLRQHIADLRINVALWGETEINERRRRRFNRAGADALFTNLVQAEREIIAQTRASLPSSPPIDAPLEAAPVSA